MGYKLVDGTSQYKAALPAEPTAPESPQRGIFGWFTKALPHSFFASLKKDFELAGNSCIFTLQVTSWLMIVQRLSPQGTLATAVGELLHGNGRELLDSCKRVVKIYLTHPDVQWDDLPHTGVWSYRSLPDSWDGIKKLEFRLVYRGELPSDSSHRGGPNIIRMLEAKRKIRAALHPQLRTLWEAHPSMTMPGSIFGSRYIDDDGIEHRHRDLLAEQHKEVSAGNHIHRYVPLITDKNYYGCSVNVLFLRRDLPGGPLIHAGDLDNRIKVLFDALRKPKGTKEIENKPQDPDQNPCFCLMEDDRFIDHVSITTDRLLVPVGVGESNEDVLIVVHVVAGLFDRERDIAPL